MKKILLFVTILLTSYSGMAVKIPTGDLAPDFKLQGHDGKEYSLSSFKGKHVVLEWTNKDCPYVKKHYSTKNMQNLQKNFSEKGVVWLSVISSAPGKQGHLSAAEVAKNLKDVNASPTAVLLDPKGQVGRSFDAKTTPHMYIVNPEGKIVYQGAIDDNPSASPQTVAKAKPLFASALNKVIEGKDIPADKSTTDPYGCSVKY
jgi:peroxiredoxin